MARHHLKIKPNFFVKLYTPNEKIEDYVIDKIRNSLSNIDTAISALSIDETYRCVVYKGNDIYSVCSFVIKNKEMKLCHIVSVREGFGAASFLIKWLKDFSKNKRLAAITLNPLENTERFYFKFGFKKDAVNSMIFVF